MTVYVTRMTMAALEGELERLVEAVASAERCSAEQAARRVAERLRAQREALSAESANARCTG